MLTQSLYHTFKRYRTLQSHTISALPIVILMPHSACNCRCIMCDIWKDNKNLKQLNESDIQSLLDSFKLFGTKQILMSGGEAMLNPNFFTLCSILKKQGLKVSVLSSELSLKKNAIAFIAFIDEVIVSLDGDEQIHDFIRNVPGAFSKMAEGIAAIKNIKPEYKITARTVIHRHNFKIWSKIIEAAKDLRLDQISFLPADVSSHAFNREVLWSSDRQDEVVIAKKDLQLLEEIADDIVSLKKQTPNFIAESEQKLLNIVQYYHAVHKLADFPYKKCNAPWVSAVIEADGSVKPCFFHASFGNIRTDTLSSILNSDKAKSFRKNLNMNLNETCKRCVCY